MDNADDLQPPQDWLDALDRADADVVAGRTVPGDGVISRLRHTLADMEAREEGKQSHEAVRRR